LLVGNASDAGGMAAPGPRARQDMPMLSNQGLMMCELRIVSPGRGGRVWNACACPPAGDQSIRVPVARMILP
jgi:hypothetical protein